DLEHVRVIGSDSPAGRGGNKRLDVPVQLLPCVVRSNDHVLVSSEEYVHRQRMQDIPSAIARWTQEIEGVDCFFREPGCLNVQTCRTWTKATESLGNAGTKRY